MAKKSRANTTIINTSQNFSGRMMVVIASVAGLVVVLVGVWLSQSDPVTQKKLQLSPTQISDEELAEMIEIGIKTGDRESSRILAGLREDVAVDAKTRLWIWPEEHLSKLWMELARAPESIRSSLPYQHLARWVGARIGLTQ